LQHRAGFLVVIHRRVGIIQPQQIGILLFKGLGVVVLVIHAERTL